MPTSNDTRVLVEGFWKIMPSVRPDRRGVSSPAARAAAVGEVEGGQPLVGRPVGDAGEAPAPEPISDRNHRQSYRLIRLISID